MQQEEPIFKKPADVVDIEDIQSARTVGSKMAVSNKRKRQSNEGSQSQEDSQLDSSQSWRDVLGAPPPMGTTKVCSSFPTDT